NRWTVYAPNGSRMEFGYAQNGNSATSAQFLRDRTLAANFSNTRAWALNKSCNANNYCVEYFYKFNMAGDDATTTPGEYYLDHIEYTKLYSPAGALLLDTGGRVEFILEYRGLNNIMPSYATGGLVEMKYRLSQIEVYVHGDNPALKTKFA